jgi:hypothetical protein
MKKTKQSKHWYNCSAPLCVEDHSQQARWYAGEEVCGCKPLNELQKRQLRINRAFAKGRFGEQSWSRAELEKSKL